jgi:hypothetical protein
MNQNLAPFLALRGNAPAETWGALQRGMTQTMFILGVHYMKNGNHYAKAADTQTVDLSMDTGLDGADGTMASGLEAGLCGVAGVADDEFPDGYYDPLDLGPCGYWCFDILGHSGGLYQLTVSKATGLACTCPDAVFSDELHRCKHQYLLLGRVLGLHDVVTQMVLQGGRFRPETGYSSGGEGPTGREKGPGTPYMALPDLDYLLFQRFHMFLPAATAEELYQFFVYNVPGANYASLRARSMEDACAAHVVQDGVTYNNCAICTEAVPSTPCHGKVWTCAQCGPKSGQTFHIECIRLWFERAGRCPMCRYSILPEEMEPNATPPCDPMDRIACQ